MFEAVKGNAIYNSVPGNNHSGYHLYNRIYNYAIRLLRQLFAT